MGHCRVDLFSPPVGILGSGGWRWRGGGGRGMGVVGGGDGGGGGQLVGVMQFVKDRIR